MAGLQTPEGAPDLIRAKAIATFSRTGKVPDSLLGAPDRSPTAGPIGKRPKNVSAVEIQDLKEGKTVASKGQRIKTLEGLLAAAEVDPSVWVVTKSVINKWDGFIKTKSGKTRTVPLWQVKAWIARKPEFLKAPVQPVRHIPRKPSKPSKESTSTCVVIPDSQNGYRIHSQHKDRWEPIHDRRAWDLAVQLCQREQPEEIILLGDMLDLAPVGRWPIDNSVMGTTYTTMHELHWWIGQLRQAAPSARIRYLEGNHEHRIRRQLLDNMREMSGLRPVTDPDGPELVSIPRLLGLKDLDVEYIGGYPGAETWLWSKVRVLHGSTAKRGSGATVGSLIKDANASLIMGHIHRLELCGKTVTTAQGQATYYAMSPGCICRIDGVVPGSDPKRNWQQGLGIVRRTKRGKILMSLLPIAHGEMVHNGDLLSGSSRIEDIRKATGHKWL
tara:strand:+ start:198 stop:1523 length:1326 start_codon:yes stop_codon:yes gene_type:complete